MGVTVKDILKIKAGYTALFMCVTPRKAKSGQSLVSYVKKFCRDQMPEGVDDYETAIDGNMLKVRALTK